MSQKKPAEKTPWYVWVIAGWFAIVVVGGVIASMSQPSELGEGFGRFADETERDLERIKSDR
jgi:hypothetical protein